MTPYQLLGMGYRLGGDPERHGVGDCFSLAAAVVRYAGGVPPQAKREWYRRLRRGDTSVFVEELNRWGVRVDAPKLGAVGLCRSENGYGLAAWFEDGWLSYQNRCGVSVVSWSPENSLAVVGCYCQRKPSCATLLG